MVQCWAQTGAAPGRGQAADKLQESWRPAEGQPKWRRGGRAVRGYALGAETTKPLA